MKRNIKRIARETAAVIMITAMAAGMCACGKTESASAVPEAAAEESAVTDSTVSEQINPELVSSAAKTVVQKETAEEPAEKETATTIEKPEPAEPEESGQEEKEEKQEEQQEQPSQELTILGDGIVFDGMELSFPVEIENMQLGKWQIEYQNAEDPVNMNLVPGEIVLATMTSPDFTEDDVQVTAEFGNYTDSDVVLSDIPLTGIYIRKGKGTDGQEPKLPEFVMPGNLTFGSMESDIQGVLGEASFSSGAGDEFDCMYENGSFMVEFAGKKETGVDYMVYCVE